MARRVLVRQRAMDVFCCGADRNAERVVME